MSITPVLDNTAFPYSAVVRVVVTFVDGSVVYGSGAVVGRNDVLTAAHVVGATDPVAVRNVRVQPAYDDGRTPFGNFDAVGWQASQLIPDGDRFITFDEVRRDYAILTVGGNEGIGVITGQFDLRAAPTGFGRTEVAVAGYPTVAGGDSMTLGRGFVRNTDDLLTTFLNAGDLRGLSGGGIWVEGGSGPEIIGVYSSTGGHAALDREDLAILNRWIAQNDVTRWRGSSADESRSGDFRDDRLVGKRGDDDLFGGGGSDRLAGGRGADDLRGGPGDDLVYGGPGADNLRGGAGSDRLKGDRGPDRIVAGRGDDELSGGKGADRVVGQRGADDLSGGDGEDFLRGGPGRDELHGGRGADVVLGGAGADELSGGGGRDDLRGRSGDDILDGGRGGDHLSAGPGRDRIDGGRGEDTLRGGQGADAFVFSGGDGRDRIRDFDAGVDRLIFEGLPRSEIAVSDQAGGTLRLDYLGGSVRLDADRADLDIEFA